jgi:GT2 family glycosyltransferase
MSEKIYILLPVHNRKSVTEYFVNCLAVQTYCNYHLVLIDDGSYDGTSEMVQTKIKQLTVLKGRGDWWWAGSLQQGIDWLGNKQVSGRDIVLFANDDITFDSDFLQNALNIIDSLNAALLLPYLRNEKTGHPEESGIEADLRKLIFIPASSPDKINCLPTRCLFMRMADLRKVGSFYPRLLPHYLSDYEFTIRAHSKGLKLVTSADVVIQLCREQSGFRSLDDLDFIEFIKRYFSKKYVSNPIYWSTFILMTAPPSHVIGLLFKVWGATAKLLVFRAASGFRRL